MEDQHCLFQICNSDPSKVAEYEQTADKENADRVTFQVLNAGTIVLFVKYLGSCVSALKVEKSRGAWGNKGPEPLP